jgi:hypothetical protein
LRMSMRRGQRITHYKFINYSMLMAREPRWMRRRSAIPCRQHLG